MQNQSKFPAKCWLILTYAILGTAFIWSANQPPTTIATSVFIGCLLLSWIPAYTYAHRQDIVQNKVYWISQSVALVVAILAYAILAWRNSIEHEQNVSEARDGGTVFMVICAIFSYITAGRVTSARLTKIYSKIENYVEKKLAEPNQ